MAKGTSGLVALLEAPTTLYRLFNADDQILYIGISVRWDDRRKQHAASKVWWPDVARWDLVEYPCRMDAAIAERDAIIAELPLHNIVYHPDHMPSGHVWRTGVRTPKPKRLPAVVPGAGLSQVEWDAFLAHIEGIGAGFTQARDILYDLLMDRDLVRAPILTTREELEAAQAAQRRRVARGTALETQGDDPTQRRHERAR